MATVTGEPSIDVAFPPAAPYPNLYRMSLEKYEAMVSSGVFSKRDRVHLVEGLLVALMTENPPHSVACELTSAALRRIKPSGWHIRVDRPVRIPSRASSPEPDIVLARGEIRDYLKWHPDPSNVALVVEVSDTSLAEDRTLMQRAYGGGAIPRYWIINLVDRQVEVYSQPSGPEEPIGYRHCEVFRPGQDIPVVIDGIEVGHIAVAEILP
jgi:Uma2 family endonuclease